MRAIPIADEQPAVFKVWAEPVGCTLAVPNPFWDHFCAYKNTGRHLPRIHGRSASAGLS